MNDSTQTCDGCTHYDPRHHECRELLGRLACEPCRELWYAVNGFECPACGDRCRNLNLADVSAGRPKQCPGFEHKPKEPATQPSLF